MPNIPNRFDLSLGGAKHGVTFHSYEAVVFEMRAPLTDDQLTRIYHMPGHIRTMMHKDRVISTFKADVYQDGQIEGAMRMALDGTRSK